MALYHIHDEGCDSYVEASDFGAAVEMWRQYWRKELDDPAYLEDDCPESVVLLTREEVIREEPGKGEVAS